MPSVSSADVIRALTRNGWQEVRTKASSHRYFQNPNKGGLVTVPFHRKDLPKGTLHSICKQAGITKEELAAML
ncbi:MAG TPA: type II toxin-antitoxin system HicA family toxin [Vicinamibacteria bacterium]